jgi:hypothetical protein
MTIYICPVDRNDISVTGSYLNRWGYLFFPAEATEDDLTQGMGTPFAMFTDLGMFLSATGNYWDNALEIRAILLWTLRTRKKCLEGV